MDRTSPRSQAWTGAQLADAVKASTNWRGVLRALGYGERSRSAGAVRVVRRRADQLGLDSSHFRGKRRWSDEQLRRAVAEAQSWPEVIERLGLSADSGNVETHVKGHAIRLRLATDHLRRASHRRPGPAEARPQVSDFEGDLKYLRVAAPTLAGAWFALRGRSVSFPAEPTVYDLVADGPQGLHRVQVKTTTHRTRNGWEATVGHHPDTHARKGRLVAYDPEVIDLFFIIDGDMTMYLIPVLALAGRVRVLLRTYEKYIVGNAGGLLSHRAAEPVSGVSDTPPGSGPAADAA